MSVLNLNKIQAILKNRAANSHKGNHGHALIIAGSQSKMGAAIIAAKSALRAGAGLVTVNIPKKERLAVFSSVPEAMIEFREESTNWETQCFCHRTGFGNRQINGKKNGNGHGTSHMSRRF